MKLKINKLLLGCVFVLVFSINSYSQRRLSISEVIKISLENNYDILLSENDYNVSQNNNTYGNAGLLPVISAQGSYIKASNDVKQTLSSGQITNRKGAGSTNINASIDLNWTLFDGGGMFLRKSRYEKMENLSLLQLKSTIQKHIADLTIQYASLLAKKQEIKATQTLIESIQLRLDIANQKYKVGVFSKSETLKAEIDLRVQKAELLKKENELLNLKISLASLMGTNIEEEFEVEETIVLDSMQIEAPSLNATKNNFDLLAAREQFDIQNTLIKEARSFMYPRLDFVSSYSYTSAKNEAGFLLLNQNKGFNYGLRASIPIFNGFQAKTALRNIEFQSNASRLFLKNTEYQNSQQYKIFYNDYLLQSAIVKMEGENQKAAQENLNIATDRFKNGLTSSLESKEAETLFQEANNRYIQALFLLKQSQVNLLSLSGKLMK